MSKKPDKNILYSLEHSLQRFEERYCSLIQPDDYHKLVTIVREMVNEYKNVVSVEKGSSGQDIYVLQFTFQGQTVKPTFDTARDTITTFLPLEKERVTLVGLSYTDDQSAKNKLYELAKKPFVRHVYGLPDLTFNTPCPVGTSVEVFKHIYPKWIGGDIGCGVLLIQLHETNSVDHKMVAEALQSRFLSVDIHSDIRQAKREVDISAAANFDDSLGTIGGGNHFAELMTVVSSTVDSGLDEEALYLCIHSGSRQFGNYVQSLFSDAECLEQGCNRFADFMKWHNLAINWATLNRQLIAQRFLKSCGLTFKEKKVELTHNFIESPASEPSIFIHRKGSIPSQHGAAMIPGSRGSFSYLVQADRNSSNLHSLPHGAGRKLSRRQAKDLLSTYKVKDMIKTPLNSYVVTNSKSILVTEHPECYKDLDAIIELLKSDYGVQCIATFKPLVTVKF